MFAERFEIDGRTIEFQLDVWETEYVSISCNYSYDDISVDDTFIRIQTDSGSAVVCVGCVDDILNKARDYSADYRVCEVCDANRLSESVISWNGLFSCHESCYDIIDSCFEEFVHNNADHILSHSM